MKNVSLKHTRGFNLVMAVGLVGLMGIVLLMVFSLDNERDVAEKNARLQADNLSQVLQEHALATMQKVDLLLSDVQEHVRPSDMRTAQHADRRRAGELHALLKSRLKSVPEANVLHITDALGNHRYSSLDPVPRINIADRPHFTRQRDDPATGLVISPPVRSRTTGKWAFVLSRRLNFEDGSFAGIVNIVLNLEYFQNFYPTLNLGAHGLVALHDKELHLAARYPPSEKDMGKKIVTVHAKRYIEQGVKHGVYHARSSLDSVQRLYSFRQVGELPLVVFAGIAEDDYLAEWRQHTWQYGISMGVFSLAVLALGLLSRRRLAEQRIAEEALRKRERQFRAILNATTESIVMIDCNGVILAVNATAAHRLGKTADDLIGRNAQDVFPPDIAASRRIAVEEVLRSGQATYAEDARDGRFYSLFYYPTPDENGAVTSVVVFAIDITGRKHAEESLRQLNETLEQRISDEVAKNRAKDRMLIQQSRLAAMGEMIGNIAHQWRQPINALTLILANLKDAYEFNELDKKYLDKSVDTGQRIIQKMSTTIDDFRNFFKPNKEKQPFRACDAVEEAVKMIEQGFRNNNIELETIKGSDPCNVIGYPNEFAQVVLNALTNAKEAIIEKNGSARHSPKVGGKVLVRVSRDESQATVSLRDNGGGIPEEILDKVFDPYFTTKEKGTGIGLYMSKMIMDNMGGDISVRNVEDGAELTITLPLEKRRESRQDAL
ncbi:MAG: ATP-binding protein [Sulfuricellaceae bacterium]